MLIVSQVEVAIQRWEWSVSIGGTIRQFEPMWKLSIWTISFGQWLSVLLESGHQFGLYPLCVQCHIGVSLCRISRVFRFQSRTRWTASAEMTTEVNKRIKLSNKQHRRFYRRFLFTQKMYLDLRTKCYQINLWPVQMFQFFEFHSVCDSWASR